MAGVDQENVPWIRAARGGRHLLRQFPDGAVVIDIDSGDLLQLNSTGALVYRHLARGADVEATAGFLAEEFGIPTVQARADVSSFLHLKAAVVLGRQPGDPSPFEYIVSGDTATVRRLGVPVLHVHPSGRWITLEQGLTEATRAALLWVVPKLLVLQGFPVLHASAVSVAGTCVAFSGASGAGKTTLAHAFAAAGAPLVAEDAFIVRLDETKAVAGVSAVEARARAWVDRALAMVRSGDNRVECHTLFDGNEPPSIPLSLIAFLDPARRTGTALQARPLGTTDTAVSLLRNLFWGAVDSAAYGRGLEWSAALATTVAGAELTVPGGLPHLEAAARRYIENTAS
jgi:hypothetical protein